MDARSDAGRATGLTRRALLAGAGATGAAATVGTATAQEAGTGEQVPDVGDWFTGDAEGGETSSYSGTVDRRGEDAVTIRVGTSGNGGNNAYAPTSVWVDPGTTITFEWASDTHNVVVDSQPDGADWSGHEDTENAGFSFEHTFETGGIYRYYCSPHLPLGMKGAVVVGDDVPMTSPDTGSEGFTFPGGDTGVAFMGVLFGTVGLAAAIVLAGEARESITPQDGRPTSAATTAVAAFGLGIVVLAVVVVRLLGA